LRAEFPEGDHQRVGAPDSGIDIIGAEPNPLTKPSPFNTGDNPQKCNRVAYQCKAYRRFTSSLLTAISSSIASALKAQSSSALRWDTYALVTPLLVTASQREKLQELWEKNKLTMDLRDIDWLERLLFVHDQVRSRFFPNFVVLFPPEHVPIHIGFPDTSDTISLFLYVKRYDQRIQLNVPLDLSVDGLVAILVEKLCLPTQAHVHSIGTRHFDIEWNLHLSSKREAPLDKKMSLRSIGISNDSQVELVHKLNVTWSMGYYGGVRPPYFSAVYDKRNKWVEKKNGKMEFFDEIIYMRMGALFQDQT